MNDPMNESDDILAGSLGRLPREMAPPGALEERTVASLRSAGLIYSRSRSGLTLASWVLAASIGAIAFVGGSVMTNQNRLEPQPMFAFTLVGGQIDDSAANVNRAAEYEAWALSVNATSRAHINGSSSVRGSDSVAVNQAIVNGDSVIVDDLIPRSKRIPDTYLIVAPSRDSAYRLAEKCPHLKYGGKVIVQRVVAAPK